MTTAKTIIERASELAGVKAIGETLGNSIEVVALDLLQGMLDSWANIGVDFGLGTLTVNSTLYVDGADLHCIKYQLMLLLCQAFRRKVDPVTKAEADKAFTALQAKYYQLPELEIPTELLPSYQQDILTGE